MLEATHDIFRHMKSSRSLGQPSTCHDMQLIKAIRVAIMKAYVASSHVALDDCCKGILSGGSKVSQSTCLVAEYPLLEPNDSSGRGALCAIISELLQNLYHKNHK